MRTTDPDLIPPEFSYGDIDDKIYAFYLKIKEQFPDAYVNVKNGVRVNRYCGLRPENCKIGATGSAHKTGKALDIHCSNLDALRRFCCQNGFANGIGRMENKQATPTWVHIDTIIKQGWDYEKNGIYVFCP